MFDIYNANLTRMNDIRNECMDQRQKFKENKTHKPHIFRNVFTKKPQGKLA